MVGVVALHRLPVEQARKQDDRMARFEEILQPRLEQVGLSGFDDFGLHVGLFVFGFRGPILTS